MSREFEPPRVDGLMNDWAPMVTIDDVMRLDALGLSAHAIAAQLNIDVLSIEDALSKFALVKALGSRMQR